jgi:hypothetical protein
MLAGGAWIWAHLQRNQGRARYGQIIEQLQKEGRPGTIADLVALSPAVDDQLQEDWDAWQQRFAVRRSERLSVDDRQWSEWVVGERPKPPATLEREIALTHEMVDRARGLLRRGTLELNLLGWAAKDRLVDTLYERMANSGLRTQHGVGFLADYLGHHACVARDPVEDLADLKRLLQALSRPACISDAFAALGVAACRDASVVDLAMLGRLPEAVKLEWLGEQLPTLALLADGIRGDRSIVNGYGMRLWERPLGQCLDERPDWMPTSLVLRTWASGFLWNAATHSAESHLEERLRGRHTGLSVADGIRTTLGVDYIDLILGRASRALTADARQRSARLVVRVLDLIGANGVLPADQAELVKRLGDPQALDPRGDHLRLVYTRPGLFHFRISVDISPPLPDFVDAKLLAEQIPDRGRDLTPDLLDWSHVDRIDVLLPPQMRHQQDDL